MSSSSSSSSRVSSHKRTHMEVEYGSRARYCLYNFKAPRWTSWTDENPRRRFYSCPNYKVGGCGFFEWHDGPIDGRAKEIVNELKIEKRVLMAENKELKAVVNGGQNLGIKDHEIWLELKRQKDLNEREIKAAKRNMILAYFIAGLSWLILVCLLI